MHNPVHIVTSRQNTVPFRVLVIRRPLLFRAKAPAQFAERDSEDPAGPPRTEQQERKTECLYT